MDSRDKFAAEYQPLLLKMIQTLVDHPDQVSVEVRHGDQTSVFEVRTHREDTGKVIGKRGRTAQALRTLLMASSTKHHVRAVMDILE